MRKSLDQRVADATVHFGYALVWITLVVLAVLVLVTSWGSCQVDNDRADTALHGEGLTDPVLGSTLLFACEPGEASREFTALRDGRRVNGVVCCGLFTKACTVRW